MYKYRYIKRLLCLIVSCCNPIPAIADDYHIFISKAERQLFVMQGEDTVKMFHVATGATEDGTKTQQGDSKTPVGSYRIAGFKADSKFHYFMHIDYPSLADAWHGYKNQIISASEFKQIASAHKKREIPPQNTGLGGYIGIHGLGQTNREKLLIHKQENWTEGCVALLNEAVTELKQYVTIGTRVIIGE